jgi:hypothetical protein
VPILGDGRRAAGHPSPSTTARPAAPDDGRPRAAGLVPAGRARWPSSATADHCRPRAPENRRAEALQRVGQAIASRLQLNDIVQLATDGPRSS